MNPNLQPSISPVDIICGDSPLILGQPHCGTYVPEDIFDVLNPRGQELADTDWHVDRLYAGLMDDVSVVRANFHRYVIDPNRPADDARLYTQNNTTGLVPETDFNGDPIWTRPITEAEIAERTETYHAPYHAALRREIARVKSLHGYAILFDCHSIRSDIPFLFDGKLPDLNIGTNSGQSCAPELEQAVVKACQAQSHYSRVLNGRFRGGWTTRHYGRPKDNVHTIQLELAQRLYLDSERAPFTYCPDKAAQLQTVIKDVLRGVLTASSDLKK